MSDKPADLSLSDECNRERPEPISATTVADISLDKLARAFEASARRWEIIVYPSIVAFAVLASFAFYLIYNMVRDVHRVTEQMMTVEKTMTTVTDNMVRMTDKMASIAANMGSITTDMNTMTQEVIHMRKTFDDATATVAQMDQKMAIVLPIAHRMQINADVMAQRMHSVTRPMNFMSGFFPMGQ